MRKHFLILMLLTLLPLAGWAEDLSLGKFVIGSPFVGEAPVIVGVYNKVNSLLTEGDDYIFDGYFSDAGCSTSVTETDIKAATAGTTFWVKAHGINMYENELKASFEVKRMTITVTVANDSKIFGGDEPASFNITYIEDAKGADRTALKSFATVTRATGSDAGEYAYNVTLTGDAAINFEVTKVNGKFTINPKPFDDATITLTLTETEKTYNGAEQTVGYIVKDGTTTLVKGTDYTEAWTNNKNAGVLTAVLTVTGMGNYTAATQSDNFTINKKSLMVAAKAQTKVYNGKTIAYDGNITAGTETIEFLGLAGEDNFASIDISGATVTFSNGTATAAGSNCDITIDGCASDNYTLSYVPAKYTITKAPLTLTAENKSMIFGKAEPVYTYTVAGAVNATEEAAIIADAVAGVASAITAVTNYEIDVTYTAAAPVYANYDVNVVKGTLTVNGGKVIIAAKNKTITYGDALPDFTTLVEGTDYVLSGIADADKAALNVQLSVPADAKNAGTYTITVSNDAVAGYSEIEKIDGTLTIEKKELTVAADMTLTIGMNEDNLEADKAVTGVQYDEDAADIVALTFDKTLLGAYLDAGDYLDTPEPAPGVVNAVKIALTTDGAKNYTLSATTTNLIIIDALVLNRPAQADWANPTKNDAAAKIANANGNTVTVKFGDFSLKGDKWYSIVLPFATTVRDFSAAFGYAVVDRFDKTNANTNDVSFKLHMGALPANEPFIFKVYEDMNMSDVSIEFVDVDIVNPADASNVAIEDAAKNKFIGTYVGKNTGWTANDYVFSTNPAATTYSKANATFAVRPLGAWITINPDATAPRILIEEPGGAVTSISLTTNENAAANGKGWYTINGMKLEGAPTEKGIYINNGKKVVIK